MTCFRLVSNVHVFLLCFLDRSWSAKLPFLFPGINCIAVATWYLPVHRYKRNPAEELPSSSYLQAWSWSVVDFAIEAKAACWERCEPAARVLINNYLSHRLSSFLHFHRKSQFIVRYSCSINPFHVRHRSGGIVAQSMWVWIFLVKPLSGPMLSCGLEHSHLCS